ncbi:MAG: GTP cyclohydrolase II [Myxococcota bacterium]
MASMHSPDSNPPTSGPNGRPASEQASDTLRRGGMVLVHDPHRPSRGGVVVCAAARTSDDIVNFMATHARGLTMVAMGPDRAERLGLYLQTRDPRLRQAAPPEGAERFTVTVEARHGVSTGISAADRSTTIQMLARADTRPEDLSTPGHVHPIVADAGGLVFRRGFAEAAVDLLRSAGLDPLATVCQVLDERDELAEGEALLEFAAAHALPVVTVPELIAHRMASESFVKQLSQATLPTRHGPFLVRAFENALDGRQHMVVSLGELRTSEPLLVRIHSECLTGDVFGSERCDCGPQLDLAEKKIAAEGRGAILYLRQEGRGIGLVDKIRAYALQDAGRDTVEANVELGLPIDRRDYGLAAQILHSLGVRRVRLMTNNPLKIAALAEHGVEVVTREPLEVAPSAANREYLRTKKEKLGHLLDRV